MIKFICGEPKKRPPRFGDVQADQFFIDMDGYLCQKYNFTSYHTIAEPDGTPYTRRTSIEIDSDTAISRVLPIVTKIEF